MIVINLFAGPGAGKSTTAAGIFYKMKMAGVNCEYVHEEAKEFTWEKRHMTLGCQPYIFAKQMRNIWRLQGQVDIAITDSPILLSHIYVKDGEWPDSFFSAITDIFNQFTNVNFFLRRKKTYNPVGRNQTFEESLEIDQKILDLLVDTQTPYGIIDADSGAVDKIVKLTEDFALNSMKKGLTKSQKGV